MKKILLLLTVFSALIGLGSCHDVEKWDNDIEGNFDALWTILDEHYCFFEEKGLDWDSVYAEYRAQITPETNILQLYSICGNMLNELRDGHVNLSAPWGTTYYKKWWSDYPQNFNERLVEEYYLGFGGLTKNGLTYAMFPDSIAYMRYPSFSYGMGDNTLDWALALLSECHGLVIDIRDNGGGNISTVETFVARFIDERILAGYICHKAGPAHDDFSELYPYYYDPAPYPRIHWNKPVVVLTNRSTFSAANNFVSVMQYLPQVTIMGDCTGGGSGMPFSSEIPCGWAVRFSASPVYDAQKQLTENGVAPDIHVDLNPDSALVGVDTMLSAALTLLEQQHARE